MPTSSVSVYLCVKVKSVCLSQSSFPLDPRAERDIMVMVSMASDDAIINEYVLADCFVYWLPSYEQVVFTFVFCMAIFTPFLH